MNNQYPLVSVIIPTYNRASLIGGAIASAKAQSYPNIQIIAVDDGSTDGTAAVLRNIGGIETIHRPNGGQAAARNMGLSRAQGEFIASLDSDDRWEPGFLEACMDTLRTHDLDFVFANWNQQEKSGRIIHYFEEFGPLAPYLRDHPDGLRLFSYPELRSLYIDCCPSPSSSVLIRRSSMVTGWNERMHIGDDWCLLLDIVLSGRRRAALLRERLWNKQVNSNNIYDGRDYLEIMKLLYVEDTYEMLRRFADRLTRAETRVLQRRYMENMVRIAKRNLLSRSDIAGSIRLVRDGLALDPVLLSRILSRTVRHYGRRQFNRLLGKT